MRCEICDFDYSEGWSASRRAHVIAHHEWEHGVCLRRLQVFEKVGQIQDCSVLLVRPSSPGFVKRRAERLSRRSIREPLDEGGFDKPLYFANGSPVELLPHAMLLKHGRYGVGIAVLERRPVIEIYRWTARPTFELAHRLSETVRWTIVHVWLLPAGTWSRVGHGIGAPSGGRFR